MIKYNTAIICYTSGQILQLVMLYNIQVRYPLCPHISLYVTVNVISLISHDEIEVCAVNLETLAQPLRIQPEASKKGRNLIHNNKKKN